MNIFSRLFDTSRDLPISVARWKTYAQPPTTSPIHEAPCDNPADVFDQLNAGIADFNTRAREREVEQEAARKYRAERLAELRASTRQQFIALDAIKHWLSAAPRSAHTFVHRFADDSPTRYRLKLERGEWALYVKSWNTDDSGTLLSLDSIGGLEGLAKLDIRYLGGEAQEYAREYKLPPPDFAERR